MHYTHPKQETETLVGTLYTQKTENAIIETSPQPCIVRIASHEDSCPVSI